MAYILFLFLQKIKSLIRLTEHNDWVIFCILGSIFAFIILLYIFHREANLKDFLMESIQDSNNIAPSWILISVVNCVLISVLLSRFIPVVPGFIFDIRIFGYQLNKFGFTFFSLIGFYIVKNFLSFLFYSSVGNGKSLKGLTLVASKFYFLESVGLIILCFALYFYPVDLVIFFRVIMFFLGLLFILKNLIYIFHNQSILPEKWYYKFLYICTLQIVPVLVLWKFLFY